MTFFTSASTSAGDDVSQQSLDANAVPPGAGIHWAREVATAKASGSPNLNYNGPASITIVDWAAA